MQEVLTGATSWHYLISLAQRRTSPAPESHRPRHLCARARSGGEGVGDGDGGGGRRVGRLQEGLCPISRWSCG